MKSLVLARLLLIFVVCSACAVATRGDYLTVSYPASTQPGKLAVGVNYTLWLPEGVAKIRGIIVHQHGCGTGACQGGATAAYDLHWQALAKKWDCALLGPSYRQEEEQNCRVWSDPRNGSAKTFVGAIGKFAEKSKHPELATAPWCLWGHSGGASWASLMQTMYPERIVAVWLRSGSARAAWEQGTIAKPAISDACYRIPTMCNPGVKESEDQQFKGAWSGCLAMFKAYRAKGGPIGFAPDPNTAHECGNSRYLAIPFFDACLAMRLPEKGGEGQKLKPVDPAAAWLAPLHSDKPQPAASYAEAPTEAVWLPNEAVARAWAEYVKTGAVDDSTPPPSPFHIRVTRLPDQTVEITWQSEADFESGIGAFIVERDGLAIAQVPDKPGGYGRPLFQAMSYHDTPSKPLPEMRLIDKSATPGTRHQYRVIAVNSVNLRSKPSESASLP